MEIPNLISKIAGSKEEEREYFLAIEISFHAVKAAIWSVINGKTHIISTSSSSPWQGKEIDDLTNASDTAISVAIQNFKGPPGREPKKVVFGLPEQWVDGEKISSHYQPYLRSVCQKLEIKPIGFVVTTEAIVHHLKSTEGVPPSVILIDVNELNIEVALVRLGQIVGLQKVARSVSLGEDVEEGLTRFQAGDMLPSRILLHDADADLEEAKQQLLDYPWLDKLPFLHLPKVDPLPNDFSIKSVALSGGTEFAKTQGLIAQTPLSPKTNEKSAQSDTQGDSNSKTKDLGFIKDKDILQSTPAPSQSDSMPQPDILPQTQEIKPKRKLKLPRISLPKIKFSFPFRQKPPPVPEIGNQRQKRPLFKLALAGTAALTAISLAAAYYFVPKATVTFTVEAKSINKQLTVSIDPQLESPDQLAKSIPGQLVEIEISGQKTQSTTGQKTIGEPAAGEVTIYNATPQAKTLSPATTLTSPSGLRFTLTQETTIASKSGTADLAQPGKATVQIKATSIGEEYNLASETRFRVGNLSEADFIAKNQTALSGGSSRKVSAITKTDQENLKKDLESQLWQDSKEKLLTKVNDGNSLIDSSISQSVVSFEYDGKAGDAADTVSLNLVLRVSALAFNPQALNDIIESEISPSVPNGYQLTKENLDPKFEILKTQEDRTDFLVSIETKLLPRISIDQIRRDISGKTIAQTETILKNLPGLVRVQVKLFPKSFPFLPLRSRNIEIIIESN